MENKKIDLHLGDGTRKVIILEGKALPPVSPTPISIVGVGGTVLVFVEKYPHLLSELVPEDANVQTKLPNDSYILLDMERGRIELVINPFGTELAKKGTVASFLSLGKDLLALGINKEYHESKDLGNFLRLNQHLLSDSNTGILTMIASLRNFKVNYTRNIENEKDGSGNAMMKKEQVINSCNLPKKIDFFIPLFEGDIKFHLQCDVEVDADTFKVILICPDLVPKIEERKKFLIDKEVEAIRKLPAGAAMPIMEQ